MVTSLTIQAPFRAGPDLISQALIVLGKPPLAEGGSVKAGAQRLHEAGAHASSLCLVVPGRKQAGGGKTPAGLIQIATAVSQTGCGDICISTTSEKDYISKMTLRPATS